VPIVDDIAGLRRILLRSRTLAVVGLSAQWHRPSYFAAKYMRDHGYRIFPVNPRYDEVLGQRCYPDLRSVPEPIRAVSSSGSGLPLVSSSSSEPFGRYSSTMKGRPSVSP